MRLHSFASGLHGWIFLREKDCTLKGCYSRVARSRCKPRLYGKMATSPNSGDRPMARVFCFGGLRNKDRLPLRAKTRGNGGVYEVDAWDWFGRSDGCAGGE